MVMVRAWLFALLFFPAIGFCGTTGKIAGVVRNAETGEPLWGANVYVPGTHLGGAAGAAGYYFVLNVLPGYHDVKAEMMGHQPVTVSNVLVVTDRTTTVDFDLKRQVIDIGEEVVVVAERPLIERDRTSKVSVMTGKEIEHSPVHSIREVLSFQGGATTDAQQQIHIRGGRTNEIAYMVDGIDTGDPLFGGMRAGVPEDALSEMVVLSGTFNAEYGNAMSGVVNIVTQEGRERLEGGLEYTSYVLNASPYRRENALTEDEHDYTPQDVKDEFDLPFLGRLNGYVGGSFMRKFNFFLSGRYSNENSYLPFGYALQREGLGKLTYRMGRSRFFVSLQRGNEYHQSYNHAWKYRYDHYPRGEESFFRETGGMTYSPSPRLFFTVGINHLKQEQILRVDERLPRSMNRGPPRTSSSTPRVEETIHSTETHIRTHG